MQLKKWALNLGKITNLKNENCLKLIELEDTCGIIRVLLDFVGLKITKFD